MRNKLIYLPFFLIGAFLCRAAEAESEPVAPQLALENIRLPQVSNEELEKFLGAAMLFVSGDGKTLSGYDLITRCSISVPFDGTTQQFGVPELRSLGRYNRSAAAPSIAANTAIEITTMLQAQAPADTERCTNLILGYFGSQYEIDGREFAPLAKRAVAILGGAPIDSGPDFVADQTALRVTKESIARTSSAMKQPLFLGAIRADQRVSVVIGEPGATIRWVAQFMRQSDGNYAFEGAMDAGVGDE